jgi:hypothetical protein
VRINPYERLDCPLQVKEQRDEAQQFKDKLDEVVRAMRCAWSCLYSVSAAHLTLFVFGDFAEQLAGGALLVAAFPSGGGSQGP